MGQYSHKTMLCAVNNALVSYMRVTYADPGARHGRNQFTGICIARSNKGLGSTFTLRNVIQRVGVERMFELYSPHLIEIQVFYPSARIYPLMSLDF